MFLGVFDLVEQFLHDLRERRRDGGVASQLTAFRLVDQLDPERLQEAPKLVCGQAVRVDLVAREGFDDADIGLAAQGVIDRLDSGSELMAFPGELTLPLHDALNEVGVELLGEFKDPHQFRLALFGLGKSSCEGIPLALQFGRVGFLELVGECPQSAGSLRPEEEVVQELLDDTFGKVFAQVSRGRVTFGE